MPSTASAHCPPLHFGLWISNLLYASWLCTESLTPKKGSIAKLLLGTRAMQCVCVRTCVCTAIVLKGRQCFAPAQLRRMGRAYFSCRKFSRKQNREREGEGKLFRQKLFLSQDSRIDLTLRNFSEKAGKESGSMRPQGSASLDWVSSLEIICVKKLTSAEKLCFLLISEFMKGAS